MTVRPPSVPLRFITVMMRRSARISIYPPYAALTIKGSATIYPSSACAAPHGVSFAPSAHSRDTSRRPHRADPDHAVRHRQREVKLKLHGRRLSLFQVPIFRHPGGTARQARMLQTWTQRDPVLGKVKRRLTPYGRAWMIGKSQGGGVGGCRRWRV